MQRVHLIISGDVVGVGFRAWVLEYAKDARCVGWVKNRDDRAVELVAEGSRVALTKLVRDCKRGPKLAVVKNVQTDWQEATGEFVTFDVLY